MVGDGVWYSGSNEDQVGRVMVEIAHSMLREQDAMGTGVPPLRTAPLMDDPAVIIERGMAFVHGRARDSGFVDVKDKVFFRQSGLFGTADIGVFVYDENETFDYAQTLDNIRTIEAREGEGSVKLLYRQAKHASDLSLALGSVKLKQPAKLVGPQG